MRTRQRTGQPWPPATTAVKALDATEGRIGGYLIVWGAADRHDLQGEYFTAQTELGLDWYDRRPVLYHHGLDGHLKSAVIGTIDTLHADETGVWAEAQIDLRRQYARAVYDLVARGVLSWSSGSLPHLVQVAADGRIERWPVVEGSLTPTPAEPRRTDVQTVKSAYAALGLDPARLGIPGGEAPPHTSDHTPEPSPDPARLYAPGPPDGARKEKRPMDPEYDITEAISAAPDEPPPARKRLPVADPADARKAAPIQVSSRYDGLDAMDLLHGYMMLRTTRGFRGVSERYANALAHHVRAKGMTAIKADELSHSTQTGYGDEWVPELWSAEVWRRARDENTVLPLFRSVEMPSNPFELPTEGTDPTVYYVQETTDRDHLTLGSANRIPDSKVGSGRVQLAAKKLALRVGFSSELVEDSIVPVLRIYREQAVRAIAEAIDHLLLNGDTDATSANINSGTAPNGDEVYMALDGLRKAALNNHAVDMLDAEPTLAKLREARFAMGVRYAARPADLAWVVDGMTYAKLLKLEEFLTMDKAGPLATAQTGQIGFIDGIPVFIGASIPQTAASGAVEGTGDTQGTALCIYRPGWMVGTRRRVSVNVEYVSYYDSYQLTATVRLAFVPFNGDVASVLHNIAV